jgi:YD repeat-containing protein
LSLLTIDVCLKILRLDILNRRHDVSRSASAHQNLGISLNWWKLGVAAFIALTATSAIGVGTELFKYDALGRLIRVDYSDGRVVEYRYDKAGNRVRVGLPETATGSFQFVSGTHTSQGSMGDIATATIRNSGTSTITAIGRVCTGGSFFPHGTHPSSIAPGATGQFQCRAMASGSYSVRITLSGTAAAVSPWTSPAW